MKWVNDMSGSECDIFSKINDRTLLTFTIEYVDIPICDVVLFQMAISKFLPKILF